MSLTKLLIWIDMKTKWSFIAVAFTALLSACSPVDWSEKPVVVVKAAAELGVTNAQHQLAGMYLKDQGDYVQALHWYTKAAEQGDAGAQYNLGVMYRRGQGVPQDLSQAVHWFKKAAEQGHAQAQFTLGFMYDLGQGVPQDDKQAVHWYRKAAEQGLAIAQLNLGAIYYLGQGVPQNYSQAYAWFSVAAANGIKDAIKLRDNLAAKLTPANLIEAQKLATQYFEKYQPK